MKKVFKILSIIFISGVTLLIILYFALIASLNKCESGSEENFKKNNRSALNDHFSKDSTYCYFEDKIIEGGHVATFEALDNNYARDRNSVFFCNTRLEATGVLFPPFKMQTTIMNVTGAVPAEFKALGFHYGKDANRAYFEGQSFKVTELATLTAVHEAFARDDQQVYFKTKPVKGSDGKTFQLMDSTFQGFAKDSKYGYYFTLSDIGKVYCHAATFTKIDRGYAKDIFAVYYEAVKLKGADPKTFQILNNDYAKDKNAVYCQHLKLPDADPATFKILPGNENLTVDFYYTADKTSVYWQSEKVNEADPSTFVVLSRGYGTDKKQVYYKTAVVKEANPNAFKVDANGFGSDGKNEFYEGEKVK